jgi:hypothetical protein
MDTCNDDENCVCMRDDYAFGSDSSCVDDGEMVKEIGKSRTLMNMNHHCNCRNTKNLNRNVIETIQSEIARHVFSILN